MGVTIPRRVFWALDAGALSIAFLDAYLLVRLLQHWVLHNVWLRGTGLAARLSIPSAESAEPLPPISDFSWILLVMIAAVLVSMEALDGYRSPAKQSNVRIAATSFMATLFGLGLVALVPLALREPRWSRLFIFTFWVVATVGVAGYRLLLRWYRLKRVAAGYYAKRVAFVGSTPAIDRLLAHLNDRISPPEFELAGYLRVDPDQEAPRLPGRGDEKLPLLGAASGLADVLVHCPIHEVIVVYTADQSGWLKHVMEACDYFRVTLRIVPEALLFESLRDLELLYHADPLQIPQIVLKPPHLDSDALFAKRLIDLVVSAALLVLLAPLLLLIAVAIKLTTPRLPVLYRWRVVGYQGRPFTGYKFSTMVADADEARAALADQNEMSGPVFKMKRDPRITLLGRFLRKYSLNELPQLWSVLKGDMSLVGPRPAFPHELQRYELWHKRKLAVKPGITCLWQVRGRNRIANFDDWVKMDLEYIDNWSLWFDLKILCRTAWVVVSGTGS
jgi:exopolysaccharide biosynthesis polyprenyl glycosylphosphotransferase